MIVIMIICRVVAKKIVSKFFVEAVIIVCEIPETKFLPSVAFTTW